MTLRPRLLVLCAFAFLAACRNDAPQALGTLEYDRITLPAPAAEKRRNITPMAAA